MNGASLSASDEFVSLTVEYGASGGDIRSFTASVERFALELGNFGKHVFPRVTEVLEDAVAEQFDSEGRAGQGGGWDELSPKYAAWKAKKFPGSPLLVRTSRMVSGLVSSLAPTALRSKDQTRMEYGTRGVEYASFHQFGTRKMPARPFMDFGKEIEPKLQEALEKGLADAARAGGADQYFGSLR